MYYIQGRSLKTEGRADRAGRYCLRDLAPDLIDFAPWADCFVNPSLFLSATQHPFSSRRCGNQENLRTLVFTDRHYSSFHLTYADFDPLCLT
jgi:hypothetical protein